MRAEADRLTAMVDDLFELSRIHAGALPLTLEPVSLDDVVARPGGRGPVAAAAAHRARRRGRPGLAGACGPGRELSRVVRNL